MKMLVMRKKRLKLGRPLLCLGITRSSTKLVISECSVCIQVVVQTLNHWLTVTNSVLFLEIFVLL